MSIVFLGGGGMGLHAFHGNLFRGGGGFKAPMVEGTETIGRAKGWVDQGGGFTIVGEGASSSGDV